MGGLILLSIGVLINHYMQIIDSGLVHKIFALVFFLSASLCIIYLVSISKYKINTIYKSNKIKSVDGYIPNSIPLSTQIFHLIISIGLISYGTYGIIVGDIYFPGKRSRGVHFNGISAWFVYFAFIFATCNLLSVVIDHYDKRNNEDGYKLIALVFAILGWGSFIIAFLVKLFGSHR